MVDAPQPTTNEDDVFSSSSSRLRARTRPRNRTLYDESTTVTGVRRTRSRSITQSRSINRNRSCAKTIQPISVNVSVACLSGRCIFRANRVMMGQCRKEDNLERENANPELLLLSAFIPVESQPSSLRSLVFGVYSRIFFRSYNSCSTIQRTSGVFAEV